MLVYSFMYYCNQLLFDGQSVCPSGTSGVSKVHKPTPPWLGKWRWSKTYFLRVIPTLTYYSGIVSDIPSGSIWKYLWHIYIYSDILSDILSGIYSDILYDILSGIRSDIYSDILYDILSGIRSDIYSGILSGILSGTWARNIAVAGTLHSLLISWYCSLVQAHSTASWSCDMALRSRHTPQHPQLARKKRRGRTRERRRGRSCTFVKI